MANKGKCAKDCCHNKRYQKEVPYGDEQDLTQ